MRRFLVLLQPVEVLNLPPLVGLVLPLLLLLVTAAVGVFEAVGRELHAVAVLDDGLAGDEDVEPAVESVVDSQLVAVQLESTAGAAVHEDCRLSHCASDHAVLQVLQEEDLSSLQKGNL
jgi:hypothetical protein